MINKLKGILVLEKPDIVVVIGDCNTSLAGAVAASKVGIKLAHVEAGAENKYFCSQEDFNRIIIDSLSDLFLCPSERAVNNLIEKNIDKNKIFFVGDILYDSLKKFDQLADENSRILQKLNLEPNSYYLMTIHKSYNVDLPDKLRKIIDICLNVDKKIIWPLHPRSKKNLQKFGFYNELISNEKLVLTDPLSYFDILSLLKNSSLALTDSSGLQREAFFLKIPCLILSEGTEHIEILESGWAKLVDLEKNHIVDYLHSFKLCDKINSPYGEGDACRKIADLLSLKIELPIKRY